MCWVERGRVAVIPLKRNMLQSEHFTEHEKRNTYRKFEAVLELKYCKLCYKISRSSTLMVS